MGGKSFRTGRLTSSAYVGILSTMRKSESGVKINTIIRSALPLLAFLIVYSLNKVLHIQPLLGDTDRVHIYTIGAIEQFLFGCQPSRIISSYYNPLLDVLSAIPYLLHYSIPVLFPVYLLWKGQAENVARFYWLLGWVMWVQYLIWLLFPHTPPWVIDHIERHSASPPSSPVDLSHREGCAFARLDTLLGFPFFYRMFSGNPIPYASFPSGHVAWPAVIYTVAPPWGNRFMLYIGWMTWAALYSCHHYVLDVIGAAVVVILTKKMLSYFGLESKFRCRPTQLVYSFPV